MISASFARRWNPQLLAKLAKCRNSWNEQPAQSGGAMRRWISSAILGNTTQSRELLETTIERTFGPAWRDPLAGLRGIAAPFDASFNQFERAITDLAQSAGWFSDDAARIAALEAYSDLIDDEDTITVTAEGDVVIGEETIRAAEVTEGLMHATEAAEKLSTNRPVTQQEFADGLENLRQQLTPTLPEKFEI